MSYQHIYHVTLFIPFEIITLKSYCLCIVGNSSTTARDGCLDESTASSFTTFSSSSSSTISPLCMLSLGRDVRLSKELTLVLMGLHSVDKEVRGDTKNCSCFFLLSLTSACHCFNIFAVRPSNSLLLKFDPIC